MTRLLVCECQASNFGFFPFADQKSTSPGKVDFFKSGHFAGQSDTFFKVQLYRAKLKFLSENCIFGPIFDFFLNRQFDTRLIQGSSYGR